MMNKQMIGACCVLTLGLAGGARAALVQTNSENDAGSSAFAVSTTDLVNQGQSTLSSSSNTGFTAFGGSSPTVLNDGSAGTGAVTASETAVTTQTTDWTLTYNLNTAASAAGYRITEIDSVSWWNSDFVNQSYMLAYSTAASPTSFTNSLGNFSLAATGGQGSVAPVALKIALTDTTGTVATGVAGLQFTFHNIPNSTFGNHQAGYREIDVLGAAVPEPASLGLLAFGGLGLLGARRRSRIAAGR